VLMRVLGRTRDKSELIIEPLAVAEPIPVKQKAEVQALLEQFSSTSLPDRTAMANARKERE
jgi:hypothetical protein